jgi:hypothetical protein
MESQPTQLQSTQSQPVTGVQSVSNETVPQQQPPVINQEPIKTPLPKNKKKMYLYILVFLVLILLSVGGYFLYKKYFVKTPQGNVQKTNLNVSSENIYKNIKYGYSIEYPDQWTFREIPDTQSGAAFRKISDPNDYSHEYVVVDFARRGSDSKNIPFEEYVKKAAIEEIQNFVSLNSIEKVVTKTGIIGYKTTWNMQEEDGIKVSNPITYFDTGDTEGDTIQVSTWGDYMDIYNKMILSFNLDNSSTSGTTHEQTIVLDVKETGEAIGTMTIPQGWQVIKSSNEGQEIIGEPTSKTIDIKKGDYIIHINSFGPGREMCGGGDSNDKNSLIGRFIDFKDQAGYEYLRQASPISPVLNQLEVCSNGVTGKGLDSFGSDEAAFGNIIYKIPLNPDSNIIKEMDNIVKSFKTN